MQMFGKSLFSAKSTQTIFLDQWMWGSFVRTALTPLLFVELALLAIYMISHDWSRTENMAAMQNLANHELSRWVQNQADAIEHQLAGVTQLTELLRLETQNVLKSPLKQNPEAPNRYAITDGGVLYTPVNDGGAAVFFSGLVKIDADKKQKIAKTARLDPLLQHIVEINPLTVQAYFNSYDSLNRIWPYFDVLGQYAAKMDIPSHGFYYEADAKHNPERKTRWIDAYLDPAGQGWMVSSISPVYNGDFLEGVVGLNITLDIIIKQVLALPIPWQGFAVLIDKNGILLAVPEPAEKLFGIAELTDHHYDQASRKQTFKPDDFNIYQRPDMRQLAQALAHDDTKADLVDFSEPYLVASTTLFSTGWRLVVFAPQNEIFKPATELSRHLTTIGWCLIGGLFFFYLLFFGFLHRRAKRLSHEISDPLQGIQNMAIQLGEGNFKPDIPDYRVKEFKSIVEQMLLTADQLQTAEQQLVDAKELAEQANYAKGAFLTIMSHELRTPLHAITGLTELARDNASDNKQKRYLAKIQQSSENLLHIVNDILDFSDIDAGKVKLEDAPFSIEELLQCLADLFIRPIENKQLELLITIDHAVPAVVVGDVNRIRHILINLIDNAIKFTTYGEIQLSVDIVASELRFLVRDTGMGISSDAIESMFLAFTQEDDSISRKFGGSGLGLAICKQLASLMGGTLSVSSQLEVGSTFALTLELRVESGTEPLVTMALRSGLRVLVIDRSPSSCTVLLHYLQEWNCKVSCALSMSQAISEIKQAKDTQPFDMLLLEAKLWQEEGHQMIQALESPEPQPIPEIILLINSAYQDVLQPENLTIKPPALLHKPVLRTRLFNTLLASQQNMFNSSELLTHLAHPAPVGLQLPGFDLREILALVDGDHKQLCHVFTMFKDDFSHIDDELSATLSKGELYEAEVQLHKLKGVAGNIGAIMLYEVSEELDQRLKRAMFTEFFSPLTEELSDIQHYQLLSEIVEHECFNRWQLAFTETLKTITEFLDGRRVKSQLLNVVLPEDLILLLQELDALLLENSYIGSELLDKIDSALSKDQSQPHQELLNMLMNYNYPGARHALANLINSVRYGVIL